MDTLFAGILDMTVPGSLVILAVLLARLALRRAPKVISYSLWLVVLLRLLCPVQISSPVSILPEVVPLSQNYTLGDADISFPDAGKAAVSSLVDLVTGSSAVHQIPVQQPTQLTPPSRNPVEAPVMQETPGYIIARSGDVWILFGSYLWAVGFAVMAAYSAVTLLRLKRKLREAVMVKKGIYEAEGIVSPFVMGLISPRIYLPCGMEEKHKQLFLAHEKEHIRRLDPVWKALGFLAVCIHWFNPLVWLAFSLACKDMETSCDEAVLKRLGEWVRPDYAAALLQVATGRRIVSGTPLAFGEGDPQGRIRNLARWKRPVLWVTVVSVTVCALLAVCLLTNPAKEEPFGGGNSYYFGYLDGIREDSFVLACEDGRELEFIRYSGFDLPEDVHEGAYVMLRARWNEEKEAYVASNVKKTAGYVYGDLGTAIENAVLLIGGAPKDQNSWAVSSFTAIANEPAGRLPGDSSEGVITIYGMALHQVYACQDGKLLEQEGSHIPVAITFRVNSIGGYCLAQYWMPRDGSYYPKDLRSKFPGGKIPDTQEYIVFQQYQCEEKAKRHFGIS